MFFSAAKVYLAAAQVVVCLPRLSLGKFDFQSLTEHGTTTQHTTYNQSRAYTLSMLQHTSYTRSEDPALLSATTGFTFQVRSFPAPLACVGTNSTDPAAAPEALPLLRPFPAGVLRVAAPFARFVTLPGLADLADLAGTLVALRGLDVPLCDADRTGVRFRPLPLPLLPVDFPPALGMRVKPLPDVAFLAEPFFSVRRSARSFGANSTPSTSQSPTINPRDRSNAEAS